jgi:glycosyltransferase involved in cell wall biosynthesis
MAERPLRILQVSTADAAGGAEAVARSLFKAYRQRGYHSWLMVGSRRRRHDPDVLAIPRASRFDYWGRMWHGLEHVCAGGSGNIRGAERAKQVCRRLARLARLWSWWKGWEEFEYPQSWRLLEFVPERPDVIHGHNLHGDYFDLRMLPWLSRQVPVVLTLHDAWLLSGHCAHSFDCERWRTGCGECPDLTIYPAIRRDGTAFNWQRKSAIYASSRLYVATPCQWLMRKVEQSMLRKATVETRVIPYGVDLTIFQPADRLAVRRRLGIPPEAKVLLFVSHRIRRNRWKDYGTLREAIAHVAARLPGKLLHVLAVGEETPMEQVGRAQVQFVPFQTEPLEVARYYQAADCYVHAVRADTFPNTVLEALACGTPVIATAVGGIPEQIRGFRDAGSFLNGQGEALNTYDAEQATGALTPAGDATALALAIERLLNDGVVRRQLGCNAVHDARQRFGLARQVEAYLAWYQEIRHEWRCREDRGSASPLTSPPSQATLIPSAV